MTSSESLRPLEELKKRLDQLTEWDRTQGVRIPAAPVFVKVIEDAIRLAEIYRDIAERLYDVWCEDEFDIDEEATSRLFKGEDGVND